MLGLGIYKDMYRLYTEVKVDKCHRNRTEVYNALLPCQMLLRNTVFLRLKNALYKTCH